MSPWLPFRRLPARGPGVTLALCGPAGVGKSHLARRVLGSVPCRQLHLLADAPAHLLLRSVPVSPREPHWVSAVSRRLEEQEHVATPQAAAALHARLSAHVPVVLVADHLHRCTPAQLEFWTSLGALVRGSKGLGLLALTRQEAPAGWAQFTVEPLDRPESDALVAATLGAPPPAPLLEWLYDRAQGHPLYTLELLRHLERGGHLQVADGLWRWRPPEGPALPPTLEGLVRSALPAQPSAARWRVLARALVGAQVDPERASAAQAGQEKTGTAEWEALGLLRGGRLAHPLYREALLPTIPPAILSATLEELSASLLAPGRHPGSSKPGPDPTAPNLAQLAQWAERAGLSDQAAARLYRAAADQASARGQNGAAARWLTRLAELLPAQESSAARWEAARTLLQGPPGAAQTQELRAQARELAWQAAREQRSRGEALTAEQWADLVTLQAGLDEPLAGLWAPDAGLVPEPRGAARARLEAPYLRARVLTCNPDDAPELVRRWEALPLDVQASADALMLRRYGGALFLTMRLDEASAVLRLALERSTDPHDRSVALNNLALPPLYRGDFAAARPLLERALAEAQQIEQPVRRAYATRLAQGNLGMIYERAGELRRALDSALDIIHRQDAGPALELRHTSHQLCAAGRAAMLLGEFTLAQSLMTEALGLLPYIQSHSMKTVVYINLITLYFHWHSEQSPPLLAHYTAQLSGLIAPIPDAEVFQPLCMVALGLAACGQPDAARLSLDRAEKVARGLGMTQGFAYATWIRSVAEAEAGHGAQAAALADEAAGLARAAQDPLKADEYALWAAYFRHDDEALDSLAARLAALEYHGVVHAVQVRRQERQAAFAGPALDTQTSATLHVLGDVQVYTPGGEPLRSRAGRQLLTWLLCARLTGEEGLSAADLAAELFPDRDEDRAARALRRLVGRLREDLGAGALLHSGERLLLGDVQSDAELFLQLHDPTLWRGLPLGGELHSEFTDSARALLLTALEGLVGTLLDSDPLEAERLAGLLRRAEPYEARLLALHLRAHDAAGHPRQAGATYRQAARTLAEVGETLPASWTDFLAAQAADDPQAPALRALSGGPASGTVSAARQARTLRVHRSTILRWQSGEIQRPGQRGRPAQLSPEALSQLRGVLTRPPTDQGLSAPAWTLAVVADYVQRRHGVRLSRSQLSRLLRQGE